MASMSGVAPYSTLARPATRPGRTGYPAGLTGVRRAHRQDYSLVRERTPGHREDGGQLGPSADAQFRIHLAKRIVDRPHRHHEPGRDRPAGQAARRHPGNLQLARGEADRLVEPGQGRGPGAFARRGQRGSPGGGRCGAAGPASLPVCAGRRGRRLRPRAGWPPAPRTRQRSRPGPWRRRPPGPGHGG